MKTTEEIKNWIKKQSELSPSSVFLKGLENDNQIVSLLGTLANDIHATQPTEGTKLYSEESLIEYGKNCREGNYGVELPPPFLIHKDNSEYIEELRRSVGRSGEDYLLEIKRRDEHIKYLKEELDSHKDKGSIGYSQKQLKLITGKVWEWTQGYAYPLCESLPILLIKLIEDYPADLFSTPLDKQGYSQEEIEQKAKEIYPEQKGKHWVRTLRNAKVEAFIRGSNFVSSLPTQDKEAKEMTEKYEVLFNFLDGSGELDGCMFGESPVGKPHFWWREKLRELRDHLTNK